MCAGNFQQARKRSRNYRSLEGRKAGEEPRLGEEYSQSPVTVLTYCDLECVQSYVRDGCCDTAGHEQVVVRPGRSEKRNRRQSVPVSVFGVACQ